MVSEVVRRLDFLEDRNTRYYHLSAILKKRNCKISRLKDDNGNWVDQDTEIKNLVRSFFLNLYQWDTSSDFTVLPSFTYPVLSTVLLEELNLPFTRDDVLAALSSIAPFKAPGLDGYQAAFYKKT